MNDLLRIASILLIVTGSSGCVKTVHITPERTLELYRRAIDTRQGDVLWPLLAETVQKRVGKATFLARFKTRIQPKLPPSITRHAMVATVSLDGQTITFVQRPDGWKLSTSIFSFYPQDSPRSALKSFVLALRRNHSFALFNMMPPRFVKKWDPASFKAMLGRRAPRIASLLSRLTKNQNNPILVTGRHAIMRYGIFKVSFIRQNDQWYVLDPD